MFSGLVNSFRGFMGWDTLEVESGGIGEDEVKHSNTDERQSLFKQLSSFMGKDVTSMISLPVWIFEPISFLQVMAEPMQFADVLEKAATEEDPHKRMAYLVAFIMAGYSCATRSKKPFNPLLGETYEFIKDDKYKFFAEQVSHHPPIGVSETTSPLYKLALEMELKTKFSGNSTEAYVFGSNHFTTTKYNDVISWGHLETCAHNIIIGGMWVDHYGNIEIINETTKDKCVLKVKKTGWLGSGRFETHAQIFNANGDLKLEVVGKWNEALYAVVPGSTERQLLWKKQKEPLNKWNWPKFNEELCAFDDKYKAILPANDSRFRSDRYHLEKGDVDFAGKEKVRLEEEQRAKRRIRESSGEHYKPAYFESRPDEKWGHRWYYIGHYWEEREQRVKQAEEKAANPKEEETTTTSN